MGTCSCNDRCINDNRRCISNWCYYCWFGFRSCFGGNASNDSKGENDLNFKGKNVLLIDRNECFLVSLTILNILMLETLGWLVWLDERHSVDWYRWLQWTILLYKKSTYTAKQSPPFSVSHCGAISYLIFNSKFNLHPKLNFLFFFNENSIPLNILCTSEIRLNFIVIFYFIKQSTVP